MNAITLLVATFSVIMFGSTKCLASDHVDFAGSLANRAIPRNMDLTDLFTWVPARGRLAVGLNSNLAATEQDQFSTKAEYRIRVRQVSAMANGQRVNIPVFSESKEVTITCRFAEKNIPYCSATKGNKELALNMKVSAGLKADPFLLDTAWFGDRVARTAGQKPKELPGPLANPKGFADNLNVLNLTIELDSQQLFGSKDTMVAIAADVKHPNDEGKMVIIDRVGRPEVTNMIIRSIEGNPDKIDDSIKYQYNSADAFSLVDDQKKLFGFYLAAGIMSWDSMVMPLEWTGVKEVIGKDGKPMMENGKRKTEPKPNPAGMELVALLMTDAQIINLAKVCDVNANTYLDLERGQDSCGGRPPGSDIIDVQAYFLTTGRSDDSDLSEYGDGVSESGNEDLNTHPKNEFPYFGDKH